MQYGYCSEADYFKALCDRELVKYPRKELPRVSSRDLAGVPDPFGPDDYHELPNPLRRQAA